MRHRLPATAPAQLAGLEASPGHEQIHLLWTDPAADGGSPLQGVVLRAATWGGYTPGAPVTKGDALFPRLT